MATITFNDPDHRNALGDEMFSALEDALLDIQKNCEVNQISFQPDLPGDIKNNVRPEINQLGLAAHTQALNTSPTPDHSKTRVVVLRARGSAFCAGFDLRNVANDTNGSQPVLANYLRRLHACIEIISRLPAVTVAAVSGAALAGGCALVSACDFVVATPNAKFGYPTHVIGLSPSISAPTLSSRMGMGSARELLLGGQLILGVRAHELGFVSRIAGATLASNNAPIQPPHQHQENALIQETNILVSTLLAKEPLALLTTKRWLQQLDQHYAGRESALLASLSGVGGAESVDRVAAIWKNRT